MSLVTSHAHCHIPYVDARILRLPKHPRPICHKSKFSKIRIATRLCERHFGRLYRCASSFMQQIAKLLGIRVKFRVEVRVEVKIRSMNHGRCRPSPFVPPSFAPPPLGSILDCSQEVSLTALPRTGRECWGDGMEEVRMKVRTKALKEDEFIGKNTEQYVWS